VSQSQGESIASSVKILVNDIEDLREAWGTLDTCFDRPEKYITEALEPVIKFRGYKAFNSGAVREFYSLLRAAMMGAKKVDLLHRLINNQALPGILAKMPANNWQQWAKERPIWIRGAVDEAFWTFVDQKWRDALNVAAAEPAGWNVGSSGTGTHGADRRGPAEATKKLSHAAIHVAAMEEKPPQPGGGSKRCTFVDVLGCPGQHAPWRCGAFGSIRAEERARIIEENRLWAFCLLHDRAVACRTRENRSKPACGVPECEGRHAIWLHELLKDIYGKEGQVHLLQGETGWRTPEETWMEDEREEEEEVMFVNTARREEDDWQEPDDSWLELDSGESEEEAGVYCISACLRKDDSGLEDEPKYLHDVMPPPEEEGAEEVRWWSPEPQGLQSEDEEEKQYLANLLTGGPETGSNDSEEEKRGPQEDIHGSKPLTEKKSKRGMPRKKELCGERENWETARRDIWLRELPTDSSENESEDGYTGFKESSRWIAEITGDATEAGPEVPRGASSEDFVRGAPAMLNTLAMRSGRGKPAAPYKALKQRQRAETGDTVCSTQGKSTKV
jgi:hypothetical protein